MKSSSPVAVVLVASVLGALSFAAPAPAAAARLTFGVCTADQGRAMQTAFGQAAKDIDKGVLAAAATNVTSNDPAFVEWFGTPTDSNVTHVRATLAATQRFIRSAIPLQVTCASNDDACAAAIAPQIATRFGDALTVCKSFFRLPLEGENSQSVALLRELTFFAGHTSDDTNTTLSAKALAKGNPPTALGEAANYAYYSALGYSP